MLERYRLTRAAPLRPRGFLLTWIARLSPAERAKRHLEKEYQQRAARRLRDSGIARA